MAKYFFGNHYLTHLYSEQNPQRLCLDDDTYELSFEIESLFIKIFEEELWVVLITKASQFVFEFKLLFNKGEGHY